MEKYIKDKLKNYELPYNEDGWNKLNKKLNKPKRLMTYSMVSLFVILFGFSYLNNSTFTAQTLSKNIDSTHITREVVETPQELIIETYSLPEEEYDNTLLAYNEEIIPIVEFEEEIEENMDYLKSDDIDDNILDNYDENEVNLDSITKSKVKPKIKPIYYVPTAFSPNDDGHNDEFYIVSEHLADFDFHLVIYDQYGFMVFESIDSEQKWKGKKCREGVYVWILELEYKDGTKHTNNGQVRLIK